MCCCPAVNRAEFTCQQGSSSNIDGLKDATRTLRCGCRYRMGKGKTILWNTVILIATLLLAYVNSDHQSCTFFLIFWIIVLPNYPSSSCWPALF